MPAKPKNPVDTRGYWQERKNFPGEKSFGYFACKTCNGSNWVSAHAFKHFKQACKTCNQYTLPVYLWVNLATRRNVLCADEEKKPHKSELCEACARGVCTQI
jgi:hypothetical protein